MTDSTLTEEQALALLQKLATDDAFRSRFEVKPALALKEIGVPLDTIVRLNAACVEACTLADKTVFVEAAGAANADFVRKVMLMSPPRMKLSR